MTDFRSDSLNCDTALERLEAVWLDPLPDEPFDAELSAAWEHVHECSACWAKYEQRCDSDRRLAEVMQAVPVPSGLKEQLIVQLTEQSCGASAERSTSRTAGLHRRVWAIVTAAAMLVFAASGSWLWFAARPKLVSIQTLCDVTPLQAGGLPVASDLAALPPLPRSWLRLKGLRIVETPRWFTPPNSKAAVAWIPFEFTKKPLIRGVLLATARNNVLDPPAELMVQATRLGYSQREGKPLSIAGWSEQGVVYVCFVYGEPAALERLLKLTEPTAA